MKYNLICLSLAVFVLTGCVTLTEKTGRLLDGTVRKEKKVSRYKTEKGAAVNSKLLFARNKQKENYLIITLDEYPVFNFHATYPDDDGGVIHFTSLNYLSGGAHGWIEFSLQLYGTGRLLNAETVTIEIIEKIEPVIITSGKINRYDTRLTGDEALIALRHRRERITALGQWMHSIRNKDSHTFGEFTAEWKPFLLPETVSKKKKPENWRLPDDEFSRAEDIKWNTGYTERVFPVELWQVRNTGTLLRDWEEAPYWLYLEYEWENIINSLNNGLTYKKVK